MVDATIVDADTLNCGLIKDPISIDFSIGSRFTLSIDTSNTTIINDLICLAVDTSTTNEDLPLLLRENDGQITKCNTSNLSYNPSTDLLKFGDMDGHELVLDVPIQYQGLSKIALNYTITIGHTDSIKTVDVVGSGLNTTKYGGGTIVSILRSGVTTTAYGSDLDYITWNAYVDATNTPTSFTIASSGLWKIKAIFTYDNSSSASRVVPIIKALKNGNTRIEEGTEKSYFRYAQGRIGTVKWEHTLRLNITDSPQFQSYVSAGSSTVFTSILSSSDFELTDFLFQATYLGPLTQYDRTPS